jgi:hypothetical protein
MSMFHSLQLEIDGIGKRMARCERKCEGVKCDAVGGVPPRCLVLEDRDDTQTGCVVVGLNPGQAKPDERNYLRAAVCKYEAYAEFWRKNLRDEYIYYTRLRQLVARIGLKGPLLWTELVKCQSAEVQGANGEARKPPPPVGTVRTCVSNYLGKELEAVPAGWPIIAVGRAAFGIVPYLFATRAVIGVPHAAGAWGRAFEEATRKASINRMKEVIRTSGSGWFDGKAH